MPPGAPSGLITDNDGTIDPKNFATIRTTSIVQREQKEHLHEGAYSKHFCLHLSAVCLQFF